MTVTMGKTLERHELTVRSKLLVAVFIITFVVAVFVDLAGFPQYSGLVSGLPSAILEIGATITAAPSFPLLAMGMSISVDMLRTNRCRPHFMDARGQPRPPWFWTITARVPQYPHDRGYAATVNRRWRTSRRRGNGTRKYLIGLPDRPGRVFVLVSHLKKRPTQMRDSDRQVGGNASRRA